MNIHLLSVLKCILTVASVLAVAASAGMLRADTWPGWRGLEYQGCTASAKAPVEWSHEVNVRWKAEIRGNGYSSPILDDHAVYVTTSYVSVQALKRWCDLVVIVLSGAVLGTGLAFVARSSLIGSPESISVRNLLRCACFMGMLVTLTSLEVFGESLWDFRRSVVRPWLGGGVTLPLALALGAIGFRLRSTSGAALVLSALVTGVALIVGGQAICAVANWASLKGCVLAALGVLPVVAVALTMLFSCASPKLSPMMTQPRASFQTVIRRLFSALLLAALLFGACLAIWLFALWLSPQLTYQLRSPRLSPLAGWKSYVWLGLASTGVFIATFYGRTATRSPGPPLSFRLCVVALAFGGFVNANFVSSRYLPGTFSHALVCLDRNTGETRWVCDGPSGEKESLHQFNSPATPTPAVAEDRIYAWFGSAGLICTDREGRRLWENSDLPYKTVNGVGASPIVHGGFLAIVSDQPEDAYVCVLEAATGKKVWRRERPGNAEFGCGVSRTPIVKTVDGVELLLVWGFEDVTAYALDSGDVAWRFNDPRLAQHCMVSSLVTSNEAVFLATPTFTAALKLGLGIPEEERLLWRRKMIGPNCTSPLIVNDQVYMVSDLGVLTCLNVKDGALAWRKRLVGRYFASPVAVGDKIYVCNDSGLSTIFEAGNEFREIARNDLAERTQASIAYGDGALFIRTDTHLYCIGRDAL